ncbi:MAG: T9SS type A sorting domain-containing protein, partial [Bacteroidota bacterium]
TSVEYTPPINGEYAVIVTLANGCSDTSDCITISTLDVEELTGLTTVYPNPGNGEFTLNSILTELNSISVYDLAGRKQELKIEENKITILATSKGLYLIHFELDNGFKTIVPYLKE